MSGSVPDAARSGGIAIARRNLKCEHYASEDDSFRRPQRIGRGVFERKIDFGPGYRVYFGKDGEALVILLGGSTKQRQQQAIQAPQERWTDYRRRKDTIQT